MFNRDLKKNFVRRPFRVSTTEHVRFFAKELRPSLELIRQSRWCFTIENLVIVDYAIEKTNTQLVEQKRKVGERLGCLIVKLSFD